MSRGYITGRDENARKTGNTAKVSNVEQAVTFE